LYPNLFLRRNTAESFFNVGENAALRNPQGENSLPRPRRKPAPFKPWPRITHLIFPLPRAARALLLSQSPYVLANCQIFTGFFPAPPKITIAKFEE
jgi:hypothetical protein